VKVHRLVSKAVAESGALRISLMVGIN